MHRQDWYYRQRVTAAEMDTAADNAEIADRRITQEIMGEGFLVDGVNPATVVENSPKDLQVVCNQFLGYSKLGERVSNLLTGYLGGIDQGAAPQTIDLSVDEVGAPTTVGAAPNEKTLTIFVEFRRHPSDPRLDGVGATVYWEQAESIQFNVVQSAEAPLGTSVPTPARADQLILADVVRVFAQTQFQNSDISQTRREDFVFNLVHGPTHVETGSDPIPNATPSVGGLESAADKTKLNTITWTDAGVGGLFNNQYRDFQPANVTAPAAISLDVSTQMSAQTPGGSTSVEGILTTPPDNSVDIRKANGDSFLNATGDKIQARLGEAAGVWTLSFFYLDETTGAETGYDMTPDSGATIVWFVQRAYSLENLPSGNPSRTIPSDQVAGEVPDATPTQKGVMVFATDGEVAASKAVQGNDSRLASGNVPVGTVIDWLRPTTGVAVPTGYWPCDGSTVTATGGIFDGFTTPDLRDKFVRGYSGALGSYPPFTTGGSDTHTHGNTGSASPNTNSQSPGTDSQGGHDHTGTTGTTNIGTFVASSGGDALALTAAGHSHTIGTDGAHTHTVNSHSHTVDSHAHTTGSGNNVPAWVGLYKLLRVT